MFIIVKWENFLSNFSLIFYALEIVAFLMKYIFVIVHSVLTSYVQQEFGEDLDVFRFKPIYRV